jgi:ArsR family transcriptional regulator, arsenate/arsenite/antimonite-responsive transcriptional repressor
MAAVTTTAPKRYPLDDDLKAQHQYDAGFFQALSDPIRVEIVRLASIIDELPCTYLERVLPVSKSTISYHVKILHNAGILNVRKEGRFYFYNLQPDRIAASLSDFLGRLDTPAVETPRAARA